MSAYAHCAIYGSGFVAAAKSTWNLFLNKGIMAIINDDLTGAGITCGALVCGVLCGGIGWAIALAFYADVLQQEWQQYGLVTCVAVFCGVVGIIVAEICLHPLPSAVQSLFVCWAEEPEVLADNRPEVYNELIAVCPAMQRSEAQGNYPAASRK